MEPVETYRAIIGLVSINDWGIFDEVARKHPEHVQPKLLKAFREIGDTITRLVKEYDFTRSVAFEASVIGRGETYMRTKARFESEPTKRRRHRDQFIAALKDLPVSDAVFNLAAVQDHADLLRIRVLLTEAQTGS